MKKILISFLLIILWNVGFSQKTFDINKKYVDSIDLENYKVFALPVSEKINFLGNKYSDTQQRFKLTKEELRFVDTEFNSQYVIATLNQYKKQLNDTVLFPYRDKKIKRKSTEELIKKYDKLVRKNSRKKIKNYDRYYYGYINNQNERLVFLRCDPHKIKYYSIEGTGESHIDVLTIYVYNIDKKILSIAGWAEQFSEF